MGIEVDRHLKEIVPTVAGISTGFVIGEFVVGYLADFIEEDMTKILVKVVGKAGLSVILLLIGRRFDGITRFFLNGAGAGLIASGVGDVLSKVVPSLTLGNIIVKK